MIQFGCQIMLPRVDIDILIYIWEAFHEKGERIYILERERERVSETPRWQKARSYLSIWNSKISMKSEFR